MPENSHEGKLAGHRPATDKRQRRRRVGVAGREGVLFCVKWVNDLVRVRFLLFYQHGLKFHACYA